MAGGQGVTDRGRAGENYACEILQAGGYRILARNYHSRYGEIDLIAAKDGDICFVEVKTRKKNAAVSGRDAVTTAKQKRIVQTALLYLQEQPCPLQPRFDVFTVTVDAGGRVQGHDHLTGAFDGYAYEGY